MERKRKEKFNEDELGVLVTEMQLNNAKLQKKTTTPREKSAIWNSIANKVNAVGVTKRSVGDIKKRWQDIKRRTVGTSAQFPVKGAVSENKAVVGRTGVFCNYVSDYLIGIAHNLHIH